MIREHRKDEEQAMVPLNTINIPEVFEREKQKKTQKKRKEKTTLCECPPRRCGVNRLSPISQ